MRHFCGFQTVKASPSFPYILSFEYIAISGSSQRVVGRKITQVEPTFQHAWSGSCPIYTELVFMCIRGYNARQNISSHLGCFPIRRKQGKLFLKSKLKKKMSIIAIWAKTF